MSKKFLTLQYVINAGMDYKSLISLIHNKKKKVVKVYVERRQEDYKRQWRWKRVQALALCTHPAQVYDTGGTRAERGGGYKPLFLTQKLFLITTCKGKKIVFFKRTTLVYSHT